MRVIRYPSSLAERGDLVAHFAHELARFLVESLDEPPPGGASLYAPRMGAWLLTAFGGLALLLASLGVYGVLAFSIARRTREIGIRMALGANRAQVFALVLREGMWLVGIGLAVGLAGGLYASQALKSFLFDVSARDPRTFLLVPALLVVVALLACYLPARRAIRVDPMVALRDA